MNEKTKQCWNDRSDKYYEYMDPLLDIIQINPEKAVPDEICEMIKKSFPDLHNKNVLVASSGDNIAAFGFYLLGANVTSTDISENQLKNAKKIADRKRWNIKFICTDSMILDDIESETYDLVYTSNGVHVWIGNLVTMYKNFNRVLIDNGKYIFFETHPFIRPFKDDGVDIKIVKPYENTGPFQNKDGSVEYAWRIENFLQGLIISGFTIIDYRDMKARSTDLISHNWFYKTYEELKKDNADKFDWLKNPWAALPQWIGCEAIKVKK
jgi:SAM-dependent methyltransferase